MQLLRKIEGDRDRGKLFDRYQPAANNMTILSKLSARIGEIGPNFDFTWLDSIQLKLQLQLQLH